MKIAAVGGISYPVKSGKKMKAPPSIFNKSCPYFRWINETAYCLYSGIKMEKSNCSESCPNLENLKI